LAGEIHVHGYLNHDSGADADIYIEEKATTGAVTVHWLGTDWPPPGGWGQGAVVQVGNDEYEGNTPAEHIWEVTCIKGDLDNNGVLNAFDIDPFILALLSAEDYAEAYPGLSGSMISHADCDCNRVLNAFDVDAFVLRLTDPDEYYATYPYCEKCPPQNNFDQSSANGAQDDSSSPAAVAALLRDNVAPERLPVVIEIAAELASAYADTPRGEFWAAVLAELE
jgi:hypothetical protein